MVRRFGFIQDEVWRESSRQMLEKSTKKQAEEKTRNTEHEKRAINLKP